MIDAFDDRQIAHLADLVYKYAKISDIFCWQERLICGVPFTTQELQALREIGELNRMVTL